MERSIERESDSTEIWALTDPEVLFNKQFEKLRKQMTKNIEQAHELNKKYLLLQKQWHDLVVRRQERNEHS